MKRLFIVMFLAIVSISSVYAKQSCAKIEGTIWYDKNADGIQNDNVTLDTERIQVRLYNKDGSFVEKKYVDENGHYEFDVGCKWYYIKVLKGNYHYYSPMDEGDDDSIDSDVDTITGESKPISLVPNETKTIDAGLTCTCNKKASLKGTVWFDESGNGIQDSNEDGIEGVTIYLLKDGKDTVIFTSTDANGNYKFNNLECGHSYSVKVIKPSDYDAFTKKNIGSNDSVDSDVNSNGISDEIDIKECQEYDNLDAGVVIDNEDNSNSGGDETKTACLGDYVWQDINLNGIQDSDEPGVIGVSVYLYDNSNNLLDTTQTDSNGEYSFCGLRDGEYKVKFDLPNTYLFTKRDIGDDTKDSDVDSSGWSHSVTIKDGKSDYSIDAGIYCECDDYKVNPNEYKKVSGGASLEMVLGLLIFVFIATSSLKYKRD